MAKTSPINPQSSPEKLRGALDFTASQKQVNDLMKTVFQDNTLNEHKIQFIQEQLHDKQYHINPNLIAAKMFEHLNRQDINESEISLES